MGELELASVHGPYHQGMYWLWAASRLCEQGRWFVPSKVFATSHSCSTKACRNISQRQAVSWPMVALCPKGIIFIASCSCDVCSSFLLLLSKDKHKVMLLHGVKVYGAIRGVPPLIRNCGTRKKGSDKLHMPAALSLEGELQFLLNGRVWVVARAGLDIVEQGKSSCTSQTQHQFFTHQAQSLGTNYPILTSTVLH